MSDVLNLRKEITAFDKSERFDVYSKIIINVTDDVYYEAGDNTGRTLTLSCPWGTQAMANNILAQMRGFSYQPYTATGAMFDPATELGDGVNVNGVHSGIYKMETTFNSNCPTDISAPSDEEIDYEYQYRSKQDREVKRQNKKFSSQLTIHSDQIAAEVEQRISDVETLSGKLSVQSDKIEAEVKQRSDDVKEINSKLSLQSSQITAEVNERKSETESLRGELNIQAGVISAKVGKAGGDYGTFGWNLRGPGEVTEHPNGYFELVANGYNQVMLVDENGLYVNGKINATSGLIGGFTIERDYLSYNGQTWGGTNTIGGYLGTQGLQLGKNFKVDMMGNLYAYSGTFEGEVNAGNIRYGEKYGTLNGSGLSEGTLDGDRLKTNTITTSYTSTGINSSLANANWAANCFSGVTDYNASISIGSVSCVNLYQGGNSFSTQSATIKDYYGNNITIAYWGW